MCGGGKEVANEEGKCHLRDFATGERNSWEKNGNYLSNHREKWDSFFDETR